MGKVPVFTPAPEPANIYWDNLEIRGFNYLARSFCVYFFVICILLVIFFFSVLGEREAAALATTYRNIDC